MRTRIVYSVIVLFAVAFTSCKDKNILVVRGTMEHPGRVKTAFLLMPDSTQTGGFTIIDSAALNDGEFSFKRASAYSQFYQVLLGSFPINIIGKNGDVVNIELDGKDSTGTYKISGSEDSEKIRTYNALNNQYNKITGTINREYSEKIKGAKNKADSDAVLAIYLPRFEKNIAEGGKAVYQFVKENENSLAAFYASLSLDRFKYEQQLVAYADHIKDKFPGNVAVANFVKAMMQVKPVSVGHKAPDFTLIDSDNQPVKLADYKGKYVMLDFWASWCVPCRKENPNVVKAYAKYKDKGLNILGISLDEDRKPWLDAVAKDGLTWRHASEFKRFEGPTVRLYKVEAIPSNFIIDPQGVIIAKNIAGAELEEFLNKTFSK
jgi:peroxiredoxin